MGLRLRPVRGVEWDWGSSGLLEVVGVRILVELTQRQGEFFGRLGGVWAYSLNGEMYVCNLSLERSRTGVLGITNVVDNMDSMSWVR